MASPETNLMLSILMPVYNERERACEAIDAVLGTDVPGGFELIRRRRINRRNP